MWEILKKLAKYAVVVLVIVLVANFLWSRTGLPGTPGGTVAAAVSWVGGVVRDVASPAIAQVQQAPAAATPTAGAQYPATGGFAPQQYKDDVVLVEVWSANHRIHVGGWGVIGEKAPGHDIAYRYFFVEADRPSEIKVVRGSVYHFRPVDVDGRTIGAAKEWAYNGPLADGQPPRVKLTANITAEPAAMNASQSGGQQGGDQ